jgi:hypothetical protein
VHVGENSPEEVAYKLLKDVSRVEGRIFTAEQGRSGTDRAYILDTYAECLKAVRGDRSLKTNLPYNTP